MDQKNTAPITHEEIEKLSNTPGVTVIRGDPEHIGSEAFMKIMGPVVMQTRQALLEEEFLGFYAGVFTALFGGIAAHFSQSTADEFIKGLLQTFSEVDLLKERDDAKH